MNTTTLKILEGDDLHCHFRRGDIMKSVVGFTARQFKRATVMPNTDPPILTADDIIAYWQSLQTIAPLLWPLMTIQINGDTTPNIVEMAKKHGAVAGKVYPQGVTTNSQNGVLDFKAIYPALEKMQEIGMLLLLHGESPDPEIFCLDRETAFFKTVWDIAKDFPNLKIVLEHITTADAVLFVNSLPENIAATITAHHLVLTLDDVVGNLISPHNFCKPIAKRRQDRDALRQAATSGWPKFFFGSDSAPHLKDKKECSHGCAGVFSAPVALQLLTQVFEEQGALDKLENFVSKFGAEFYGLPQSSETITLVKQDWKVPEECNGIVPFMAGQTLRWKVAD